jgi:hypothetical protein
MGKDICLGCSKKFTKSEAAIQCMVCGLWIHKTCANMSDETFNLLDTQRKDTGTTYWACRPCTTYAKGMNHRLRQIEDDMKIVKESTASNKEAIQNLEKKVAEVTELAKRSEGLSREEFEKRMREEGDEAKERKARELNVIIHGLDECQDTTLSGGEKMRWDVQRCVEMFSSMELAVQEKDIKFSRRVGQRGEGGRPLVVGFHSEKPRSMVLKADWRSSNMGVTAGPDMTKRQREEEAQIWKDLETKNNSRSEDEKSKNLMWRIVGQKGERRLVLGAARPDQIRPQGAVSAARGNHHVRGAPRPALRGATRTRATRGRPVSSRLLPPPPRREEEWRPGGTEEDEDEEEMTMEMTNTQQQNSRERIGSKRKERDDVMSGEEEEGMSEPPAKH